jgi:hypothetical protein
MHFSPADPQFLDSVFLHLLENLQEHPLVHLFALRDEARLCMLFELSALQDSFRFKALNRARRLSLALLNEKGEFNREFLRNVTALMEKEGHLFYPLGTNDSLIHEHILRLLHALDEDEVIKFLKRFQKPLANKWADQLIFETLGVKSNGAPSEAQIRAAVLCACLTPLRQNVGSCFATAPAILIQSECLQLFLNDLYQLLTTGKLKRTFGGVEYAIALSPSTGIAELKRKLILSDTRVKVGFCPGLIIALEKAEVIDPKLSIEEKGRAAQSLIEELSRERGSCTVEEVIRRALMRKWGLSEDDLEKGRKLEAAQLKSSKISIGMPDPRTFRKLEQLSAFYQEEKECRAAFKGICDNALLKAWEFTIASFSEVKMEFSRWNLYSSLGLSPQEPGGIGELLYSRINEKITEINKKLQEYQTQYEIAFDQLRATQALLRNASSESDARRLQAEHQSRSYHMRSCLDMRDAAHSKGSNYSDLFSFLLRQYDQKFPEYFQEIYDAEMQDLQGDVYEDSPAGFRLVYKHGRSDPSLWTLIYDADQYIRSLFDFFSVTESQIAAACQWEGGEQDVLELTSAIISHIRSETFLETALQRMAKAHQAPLVKSPLANLQMLEKKPWAYTSGGTMTTLLKTYCCRQSEFTQEEKWVESESELMIFILDTLKTLPPKITDPYLKDSSRKMLMTSPNHAFLLLPAEDGFFQGWQEDTFTYTWVRDNAFIPSQEFYSEMRLDPFEQAYLVSIFCNQLPALLGHHLNQVFFPKEKKLRIVEYRNLLLDALLLCAREGKTLQKQTLSDALDAFLYQNLPVVKGNEYKAIVRRILSDLMNENVERALQLLPDSASPLMTAHQVREAAKGCYLLAEGKLSLSFDLHRFVSKHARFVGIAQPTSLLFADTNWTGNYFGFIVNPGTNRLELWRLDRALSRGSQMSQWKSFLNGSSRKSWSIFTRPSEYGKDVVLPRLI